MVAFIGHICTKSDSTYRVVENDTYEQNFQDQMVIKEDKATPFFPNFWFFSLIFMPYRHLFSIFIPRNNQLR